MFFSLLLFFLSFIYFLDYNMIFELNIFNYFNLSIDFFLNKINTLFSLLILMISMGVLLYSKYYFNFSIHSNFKTNLLIFIFSMLILVNSNNFFCLMIGWDGLGVSSFFLVAYYANMDSSLSSFITFFFNRLGDSFMIIICSLLVFMNEKNFVLYMNYFLLVILFLGLITKSSQIPFGIWLPMAMSAPTPISSLVHSSTLVTAGIFVMIKMEFLINIKEISLMIFIFSILTFILGGLFSVFISDLKKAVAFSTLSQLGFILLSISLSNLNISFYHLIFHAFFKSSLFINLGLFMKFNFSIQDSRILSNNSKNTFFLITFIFSCLNLMGLIGTVGFLSKDLILMFFFSYVTKMMINFLLFSGCLMTACYTLNFVWFLIKKNTIYMKNLFKMSMKIFFSSFLVSGIMMLILPLFLMNLLLTNFQNFVFLNHKIFFYLIILISLFINKMIFSKFKMLKNIFSSMIMILDLFYNSMNSLSKKVMKETKIIFMIEEFIQLNLINLLFTKMKNLFLLLMILNSNLIYMIILLKNF